MSGRSALPLSIPVFSELTTAEFVQARRVVRKEVAIASLIVCSVVAMRCDRSPDFACKSGCTSDVSSREGVEPRPGGAGGVIPCFRVEVFAASFESH